MANNGHKPVQLSKPFRNRITGAGMERVDQLLANPANWRMHPDNQQQALAGAIDDLGFIRSVTVNRTTGCVLDGHLRVTLAARSGVDELPVEYVELSPAEEAEALLTLDPIGAMAAADKTKLDELMRQVNSDDERVQKMISELAEREHIQYGDPPPEDPGAQIDRAEELRVKWDVRSGQLWQLGEHRLICGDCTDRAVVERVLNGEPYNVLTDPPYNIGFNYESIDDKMSDKDYLSFCRQWFDNIVPGAIGAIFSPGPHNEHYYPNSRDRGFWIKRNATAGASCFHLRLTEPLLFYGKFEIRRNTDVFEYSMGFPAELTAARCAAGVEDKHPPAKSMPLWEELVTMFYKNKPILDVFLGNGTTLIACERLGRKCRAVEISPAYCAVAIERWAQMTGMLPIVESRDQ